MRIYISVDMEGIAGVAAATTVTPGTPDYEKARIWMTREANAAVAGAFAGGAREVVVNDSHGPMNNLLPDQLDRRARLLTGSPKPYSMVQGIESGFDGAMFVGYHGAAGTAGSVLAHTFSGQAYQVRLNGKACSETQLNATLAAVHSTPVLLVTGDQETCADAADCVPGCSTVQVKESIAVHAALSLHPEDACDAITAAAEAAVRRLPVQPIPLAASYVIEVDVVLLQHAELASLVPGTQRVGGRTLRYESPSFVDVFHALLAWLYLAPAALSIADGRR
jgi:D-amino peptidase